MYTDFLLIKEMKQGSEHAFDAFIRKYYEDILRYCSYHCFDIKYAEDLTQETFVRFFTKLSDYRYKGKTKNYLYTVAGNLCKDYLKKIKEIPVEETEENRELEFTERQAENVLNRIIIEQALRKLPDEQQEVVVLYYFQELKLAEIAGTLQIGLPLVKYRLKQAKIQLEKLLRKEEVYEFEKRTYE